jgi:diacylglycerol O-acyltransferase
VSTRELNRRLTSVDATFLYTEKPTLPMHVGGCMIYEGHVSLAELIAALEARLHLLPRYRQKVVFPPFGIAHPTWEDDPAFDIRNHAAEISLPPPGDERTLSEAGGAAFAGMLDREHPLWKLIVVHGRSDGNTAVIWKIHHAMIDGVSGVDLTMVLHDLKADSPAPAPPSAPWRPQPVPDPLALLQDSVRDRLTEIARVATDEAFRLLRPTEVEARVRQLASALTSSAPNVLRPAPRVPFNGSIGLERHFGWAEFSFGEFRHVKAALGGTVNDVVLAVIAGGLGRYLRALGLPTGGMELRAMCPVSMRRPDQRGALGNLVSMIFAPLYVGELDPVARLTAEREAMERLKNQDQAGGLYEMTTLLEQVPPALAAIAGQLTVPNTLLNTVSTNVPGPQIPLFLSGRRLIGWYPLLPLAGDVGLCNAILTYDQRLTIGVTTDPRLVPDVWLYVECLKASFAELREAAGHAERAARATGVQPQAAIDGDRLVTGPRPNAS